MIDRETGRREVRLLKLLQKGEVITPLCTQPMDEACSPVVVLGCYTRRGKMPVAHGVEH
jgi:hypothetical protein